MRRQQCCKAIKQAFAGDESPPNTSLTSSPGLNDSRTLSVIQGTLSYTVHLKLLFLKFSRYTAISFSSVLNEIKMSLFFASPSVFQELPRYLDSPSVRKHRCKTIPASKRASSFRHIPRNSLPNSCTSLKLFRGLRECMGPRSTSRAR